MVNPVELKNYEKNARTHSSEQIEQIVKSIKDYGFNVPVEVNSDFVILSGHARVRAATEMGLDKIPVIVHEHLKNESKQKGYILAANKIAMNAGWDDDILTDELRALMQEPDFDMESTGFGLDELAAMFPPEDPVRLTDDDEVPGTPKESRVKLGDVWTLGEHRLMCGDSTSIDAVDKLMDGNKDPKKFVLITDPPYGIKRDKGFGGFGGFRGVGEPIKRRTYDNGGWDDEIPPKEFFDLILKFSHKALIFGGNFFAHFLPQGKHWIVWDKKNTMPTFGDAELIWTNIARDSVKIKQYEYNGLIGKEKERFHPTQKPVALLEDMIQEYMQPEETVLDLFGGSGSTLIACEKLQRKCYMMELDPVYCEVILQRWENFTGKRAQLV